MDRIEKDKYYLNIAETVAQRSTCLCKHWGAVIVKDDTIISTGFNGAPRNVVDCLEKQECRLLQYRRKNNLGRGTAYEQCLSVHAEMNAIIFADKNKMKGATMYLVGKELVGIDQFEQYVISPRPCAMCRKMIINAGIENVVVRLNKNQAFTYNVKDWTLIEDDIVGDY